MAGPFPLATLGPVIDATGISAPPYSDILASLQASVRGIYGQDTYLEADSADGQLLAVFALAQHVVNDAAIAVYNAYSPASAIGAGLSSIVKINGLSRSPATNSTADLVVTGQSFTQITGGIVRDGDGNQWALPAVVIIPFEGQITVTATCQAPGAVAAAPETITQILNPVPGWQTATNPNAAILGAPVETDAQLRLRQAASTALPALSPRQAIEASILAVPGVTRAHVYDNDTDGTDNNGIPAHTVAAVVAGGDTAAVAQAIRLKKIPGAATYGSTSITLLDTYGVPVVINFFPLETIPIFVAIAVQPLTGYIAATGGLVTAAIETAINSLLIGEGVHYDDLAPAAKLQGEAAVSSSGLSQTQLDALSKTYIVRSLAFGLAADALGTTDAAIAFSQAAACSISNVTLTLQQ